MEIETLRDLYVAELKDLWSAENQILKALPRMIRSATHYGTCRTWARTLGYENQAQLLQTTLDEEQQTDLDLTALAVSSVNIDAE